MANRRMFSLDVVGTDSFLDLPLSAQALYFHLGLYGDDDGFVGSPRKIARGAQCSEDDIKTLRDAGFVISFESGVVVIRDWLLNNTVKNDRYKPTIYCAEKSLLTTDEANRYRLVSSLETDVIQVGNSAEPQHNLTEQNKTKINRESADKPRTRSKFEAPSVEDVERYASESGLTMDAGAFCDYYAARGWRMGNSPMEDWKAAVRRWVRRELENKKDTAPSPPRNDLALAEQILAKRKKAAADG